MKTISLADFMDLVYPEPNTGCWLWGGQLTKSGYGDIHVDKMAYKRISKAHRVSYYLHFGSFPLENHVLHKCDNRCCVNPSHLYLGTHQQNMEDRVKKGRNGASKGENNIKALLTNERVLEIRRNIHISVRDFADKYGLSYFTVWDVRKGRSWKHIIV